MMNDVQKLQAPSVLVIFGATGDLAKTKIYPALFRLYANNKLPKLLRIVGFSRRGWGDSKFRSYVRDILEKDSKKHSKKTVDDFINSLYYQKGNFENLKSFSTLAEILGLVDDKWQFCANKLFYLAVPPKYYRKLFTNLEKSGLTEPCSPEEGWTRVIVEKPFGRDLKTAKDLDELLGHLFKEEQIYRVDHYLGKDMLQNILAFRFSNNMFEQSWNNKFIDRIEVKLLEKEDVSHRAAFYDGVGAFRDVGQNHLLQMLALVTMENPGNFTADAIRKKRLDVLSSLKEFTKDEVEINTFRGQYEGYEKDNGVKNNSDTETYFKIQTQLMQPKWRGVKMILEAGKSTGEDKKEIVVRFKHPHPCMCPPGAAHDYHNKVIFSLEPKEEITFRLWYKKPGYDLLVEKRSFDMKYRQKKDDDRKTQEYEKLLLDCFVGDQTLFVSTEEIEAMWSFADPILAGWQDDAVPLVKYDKNNGKIRVLAKQKINQKIEKSELPKEVGVVGLGKMGGNIARQLTKKGWNVVGYNRTPEVIKTFEKEGIEGAYSYEELFSKLVKPRVVILSVPAGEPTTKVIEELAQVLDKGDVVLDFGNSFYEESIKNAEILKKNAIDFADVGISGGPSGALYGACLMIGGNKKLFDYLTPLYVDLATEGGYEHFEGVGAGHFVKMVHNGIEYGIMQAIAEGFDVLKNSDYKIHLKDAARIYNNGSVIESRLIDWMYEAFDIFGNDLKKISGSAGSGGAAGMKASEAKWTADVAKKLEIPVKVINEAINARIYSQKKPNYQGKIINALRNRFGGHDVK